MDNIGEIVSIRYFDHIKWGGPCPPIHINVADLLGSDRNLQMDQESMSTLLAQIADEINGTEERVRNRRKVVLIDEYVKTASIIDAQIYTGGSIGEGFLTRTSDLDQMIALSNVIVINPEQRHLVDCGGEQRTILLTREADCRSGYVALELLKLGEVCPFVLRNAIIPVGNSLFVSSDIYRQQIVDKCASVWQLNFVSNGPCVSYMPRFDYAFACRCLSWPREADEWIHRTRFHGWPPQTMIDRIVQGGYHLVPVGDKCSADTLLQWRISFACAERMLVHSLTHPQFRVYGLLKYFLSQIKGLLEHVIGDSDILCSYFLKTIIFHSVEKSPSAMWHEKNTFLCLRFCLSILIAWVKSGYCPNYFIQTNNMFTRKVHGENRQKLLHFLKDCFDLKWPKMFLSVEAIFNVDLALLLHENQDMFSNQHREYVKDIELFLRCFYLSDIQGNLDKYLGGSLRQLAKSVDDVDDFIAYMAMVGGMCSKANRLCIKYNTTSRTASNKQKYKALKKSKHLLIPQASTCASPGLMKLATFHYLTGNYSKALGMCRDLLLTSKLYLFDSQERSEERYKKLFCGMGYTLFHKMKSGVYSNLRFTELDTGLCLPEIHPEISNTGCRGIAIPPLPYASFLSFMCYHELGDRRRRDTELINLRALNYNPDQGGHKYWIVHTLLGICYQTVGDNRKAIRSFMDSLRVMPEKNPAKDRIDALRN